MGDGFACNRAVSLVVTAYHMNAMCLLRTRMGLDTEHQAWATHGRNDCIGQGIGVSVCMYVRTYV